MDNDLWAEVAKLVAEYDAKRPKSIKELRLYYNPDGTIIGLWEMHFPEGDNYIVLDNAGLFYNTNTNLLRVQNKKLIALDPQTPLKARLQKSTTGFRVVKGHAALILDTNEEYYQVEHYDRTNC